MDWNKIYLALLKVTHDEIQAMEALLYLMKTEDDL
jgi:hypothetical protein